MTATGVLVLGGSLPVLLTVRLRCDYCGYMYGQGYHPVICKAWPRYRVVHGSQWGLLLGVSILEGEFKNATC